MKKLSHIFLMLGLVLFVSAGAVAQTLRDGIYYTDSEQYAKARNVFKTLLSQNASAENLYYFGEYYLKLNTARGDADSDYIDSARTYFSQGIAKDPNYVLNYVGLGSVAMFNQNKAEAQKHFSTAMSKSGDVDVRYRVGQAYLVHEFKDPVSAIELLEGVVKKEKKRPELYLTLGDAYLSMNEGGKAAGNYDQALNLDKKSPKPHIRMGRLYSRARNYTEALRHFQQAVAADSSYSPAYREIGELYYMAQQYDKAIANYRKYISKSDEAPETLYKYGAFLFLNKDYAEAVRVLEPLVTKMNNPVVYRLIGYSYAEMDSSALALQNLETFFAKADQKKIITSDYQYFGKVLAANGRTDEGIAMLRQAITGDPKNYQLYDDIGDIYFKGKAYDKAADAYTSLISATPEPTAQQYFTLGRSYYFAKNNAMADSTFSKVISMLPESPSGYLWEARTKVRFDPESTKGLAQPYYEKYVELIGKMENQEPHKKDLVEAYSYLGYYYVLRKDQAKALEAWNKVLEYDPNNQKAKQGLSLKVK